MLGQQSRRLRRSPPNGSLGTPHFSNSHFLPFHLFPPFCVSGDAKSEDPTNKDAGEEKPEEDNDYHRSDEQVADHVSELLFRLSHQTFDLLNMIYKIVAS